VTERERLIELLWGAIPSKKDAEDTADYLLENGVIVPPCKVGDVVYVIEPCTCYNGYSDFDRCHHKRTKATKWIDIVRVPKKTYKRYTRCLKLFERPFKVEYLNNLGKTVYLTKEEAEQALTCRKSRQDEQ
jgi:hypothetical protein